MKLANGAWGKGVGWWEGKRAACATLCCLLLSDSYEQAELSLCQADSCDFQNSSSPENLPILQFLLICICVR